MEIIPLKSKFLFYKFLYPTFLGVWNSVNLSEVALFWLE